MKQFIRCSALVVALFAVSTMAAEVRGKTGPTEITGLTVVELGHSAGGKIVNVKLMQWDIGPIGPMPGPIVPGPNPTPFPTYNATDRNVQTINLELDPKDPSDAVYYQMFLQSSGWWGAFTLKLDATGQIVSVTRHPGYVMREVSCYKPPTQ